MIGPQIRVNFFSSTETDNTNEVSFGWIKLTILINDDNDKGTNNRCAQNHLIVRESIHLIIIVLLLKK